MYQKSIRRRINLRNYKCQVAYASSLRKHPNFNENFKPRNTTHHDIDNLINIKRPVPLSGLYNQISKDHNTITLLCDIKTDLHELKKEIQAKNDGMEHVLGLLPDHRNTSSKLVQDIRSFEERVKRVEAEKIQDEQKIWELAKDKQNFKIQVEKLDELIKKEQQAKKRADDENFREFRAYESSLVKLRTLEKKNFFTPIDSRVVKRTKRGNPPLVFQNAGNLLFQTLASTEDRIHEFMIINNENTIVIKENPLGKNFHRPDLFTLVQNLGPSEKQKYWDIIMRHQEEYWNLIATESSATDKILVFERYITHDELKKLSMSSFQRFFYDIFNSMKKKLS